jgi:uncharacterized membrane protein
MPSLSALASAHPIVVHFAIGLLVAGVVLRLVSLLRMWSFTGPAAAALLLVGTGAAALAVKSGTDAHGPAERVPGARAAVQDHEKAGEWTRNVFLVVAAAELLALVLARRGNERPVLIASAGLGVIGLVCLIQASSKGGDLVYAYAGGVGLRRGDPEDVGRLLLAGLYHQAQVDRKAGRGEEAAYLFEVARRRFPADVEVQLLAAESQLLDRKDAAGTLSALAQITVPKDAPRLRARHGLLMVDALVASGQKDAARAALQGLRSELPDHPGVKRKLDELGPPLPPAAASPAAPAAAPAPAPQAPASPTPTP